jgi:hypothetical protein
MKTQNAIGSNSNSTSHAAYDAEATLRLIAKLPAPQGLQDRVIAGMRSAPRAGRVLSWPRLLNPTKHWLRFAAAAAIAFVVIGGGWGVYSRIQPFSAVGAPPTTGGAFSNAGAVRVPQTVPAPVVVQPAPAQPSVAEPVRKMPSKVAPAHKAKAAKASKPSVEPSSSTAQ